MFDCDTYENDIYIVMVFRGKQADWQIHDKELKGQMTYISIKNRDKTSIHDWRHLQQIKNELVGVDCEAVEIYPNEDRLVATANQYHLFVLDKLTIFHNLNLSFEQLNQFYHSILNHKLANFHHLIA